MTISAKCKRCSLCGEEKEIAAFSVDQTKRDGHQCQCRDCYNQGERDRRLANNPKRKFKLFLAEYNARLCPKCKQIKSYREFSKSKLKRDGFNSYCKSCRSKNSIEFSTKRKSTIKHKAAVKKWSRKNRLRYPEKTKAKKAIRYAVKTNKIIREKDSQFHHWSYLKENFLDALQLIPSDHYKIHKYVEYDQNHKCYRTLNGELLNSKQLHIDYIARIL